MGMLGVVMGIRYVEGVDGGFVCVVLGEAF